MKKAKYVTLKYFGFNGSFKMVLYVYPINSWSVFKVESSYIPSIWVHSFHRSLPRFHEDSKSYKDPFRVFVDTFKSELKKSKEFQESVKALQDKSGKLGESEAYKKAKEAYKIAKDNADVVGNISNKTFKKIGRMIGTTAIAIWKSGPIKFARKGISIAANAISMATYPIRENKIYKLVAGSIRHAIHDGDYSHYAGYVDKKTRRQIRKSRNKGIFESTQKIMFKENSDADVKIVIYKESSWKTYWRQVRNNSWLLNRIDYWRRLYNYSENPVIETIRSIIIGTRNIWHRVFAESEGAKVAQLFKNMDPNFRIESFLQELREYILPEVVEAYVKGDAETLKLWLGEASYQIWYATAKEYISQGLVSDGKVLDIRGVNVITHRILPPNDIPCVIISFRTQEIHLYKNAKSKEVVAGSEDFIQEVTYAAAFTKIPDEVLNVETRGWKIIDFVRTRIRDIL